MGEIFYVYKLFWKEVPKYWSDSVKVGEKMKDVNGMLLVTEQEFENRECF